MLQCGSVYSNDLARQERNESLLLVLQQAQEELIHINNSLEVKNKIDEQVINGFIEVLCQHALAPEKETAFTGIGKKLLTAAIVVGSIAVIMFIGYYLVDKVLERKDVKEAIEGVAKISKVIDDPKKIKEQLQPTLDVVSADLHKELHGEIEHTRRVLNETVTTFEKITNAALYKLLIAVVAFAKSSTLNYRITPEDLSSAQATVNEKIKDLQPPIQQQQQNEHKQQ